MCVCVCVCVCGVFVQVVSGYSVLAVNIFEPDSSPQSSEARHALLSLALLPHVSAQEDSDSCDPIAWPAIATWTQLAEYLMDVRVGRWVATHIRCTLYEAPAHAFQWLQQSRTSLCAG